MVGTQPRFCRPACHSMCTFHLMCTLEGVSPVSFKYHVFDMSLKAMRFKQSCAVKINLEMRDYNGEMQFLKLIAK